MEKLFERQAILGTIDPDAYAAGTYNTDWVPMSKFRQAEFDVMVGTFGADATVDFKLQEATSSGGAGAQDLSGKAITQLVDGDDDKQAIVNVRADELSDGYHYVCGVLVIATEAVDAAVLVKGGDPVYLPASDFDLDSVDEIVP